LRVPFIVVSPWVPKKIFHDLAPEQKPTASSVLEHTSTWQTLKKLFGLHGDMSVRSKWAADYANWFSLSTPRTDLPRTLPSPAKIRANSHNYMNGLQKEYMVVIGLLGGLPAPRGMTENVAGAFVVKAMKTIGEIMATVERAKNAIEKAKNEMTNLAEHAISKAGQAVAETATKAGQTIANTATNVEHAIASKWNHLLDRHKLLLEIHAKATAQGANVKSWHEVDGESTNAGKREGKGRSHQRGSEQHSLHPTDSDVDAFFEAAADLKLTEEMRLAANSPIRGADGDLIGPDASNPLFDVGTYIDNGPYFMPGILSGAVEEEGLSEHMFEVFKHYQTL